MKSSVAAVLTSPFENGIRTILVHASSEVMTATELLAKIISDAKEKYPEYAVTSTSKIPEE